MDGQNAQLDIKKHGSGMMMLLIVLVRSRNYGNASKEKYLEAKKKARRAFYVAKCKRERKRFGNVTRGMIKNVMCLRLGRGCQNMVRVPKK